MHSEQLCFRVEASGICHVTIRLLRTTSFRNLSALAFTYNTVLHLIPSSC